MVAIRTAYRPRIIESREDVEPPIRAALAESTGQHITAELPGLTLEMHCCAYPDRTPLWDHPRPGSLARAVAFRPDGQTLTIDLADGHDWDTLTTRLIDFQGDWDGEVMLALSAVESAAREEQRIKADLQRARAARTKALREAEQLGVSRYQLAKASGISQPGVKKILDA